MLDPGFYNADCMEALKEYPDNHFDLAICDPPYGIGADKFKNGDGRKNRPNGSTSMNARRNRLNGGAGKLKGRVLNLSDCSWDAAPPDETFFQEVLRVARNAVIWGGNYFKLPPTRGIIVWDKMQPWENFSQVEMAWTSFDRPAALFKYCNSGAVNGEIKFHPTQKPVRLYEWILEHYAKPGDKILDPMAGSGSCLIACRNKGYECTGFEIDEQYYQKAAERIERETAQMNIFDFI